jgi:hypothetical protein
VRPVTKNHPIGDTEQQQSARDLEGSDANAELAQPINSRAERALPGSLPRSAASGSPVLLGQSVSCRQKPRNEANWIDEQQ